MSGRIKFGADSSETLTYVLLSEDGLTIRTAAGTSLPQIGTTGYFTVVDANMVTGDVSLIKSGTTFVGFGVHNPDVEVVTKTGFKLASDGLDSISTSEPSGKAGNFREMIVQIWRRLFGKTTLTSTELKTYKADGSTVATTQIVSETSTTQTQGESS